MICQVTILKKKKTSMKFHRKKLKNKKKATGLQRRNLTTHSTHIVIATENPYHV